MHLDRSMNVPLQISMSIDSLITVQAASPLIPRLLVQAARVESIILQIWIDSEDLSSDVVLQHLRTPFPGLRHLELYCSRYTVDSYLSILQNTPALETLKLSGAQVKYLEMDDSEARFTLARLHTLTLSNIDSVHFMPGQLLLTPSLVTFIWSAPEYSYADHQLNAMPLAASVCPQ